MTCHNCRIECRRFGKRKNRQRYQCCQCRRVFTEPREDHLNGMYTPMDKAVRILELLTEGTSVSAVERLTGVHHTTILTLLVQVGERCERFAIQRVRKVPVKDVQVDELWGFIQKKEGHKWPHELHDDSIGDSYTFVGIERNTKLILCWLVGRRTAVDTQDFVSRLRYATADGRFQLTSDGFGPYVNAMDMGLSDRVDYSQLIKVYRASPEGEHRYSPADVVSAEMVPVMGNPDPRRICTSHVERQNLTMRMQIRRLTRLTNGFSKTRRNHKAAIALYFCCYNFCRVHRTLRTTPAMAANLADHIWTIRELLEAL